MSDFTIVCIGAGEMFQYCIRAILRDREVRIPAIFTGSEKVAHRMSRFILLDSFSREIGIPLIKLESMNDPQAIRHLKELKPDIVFVDGWSEKLSPAVLEVAKDRFICLHPSLLPKARGGATLNWALIRGEREWGITLFYLNDQIDQGDMIAQERFLIEERDDIATLFDKASVAAMDLLARVIPQLRMGKAGRIPQDHAVATFSPRRKPEQGAIDWTVSANEIAHLIRALAHPYPGAFFHWDGKRVFVWKASLDTGNWKLEIRNQPPVSKVLYILQGKGIVVSCGEGALFIERLQLEGKPPMWADDWCQRHGVREGENITEVLKK